MTPADSSPCVPSLAECAEQILHPSHQIRLRSLQQQMEMIVHQNPRVHPPTMTPADLIEPKQEALPVLVIFKDHLPSVAPRHDMINSPRILIS